MNSQADIAELAGQIAEFEKAIEEQKEQFEARE
jgi:peptidoglycan hydrolase CwlO-like protein